MMTFTRDNTEVQLEVVYSERRRQERLKYEGKFKYTCADAGMANGERLACLGEEFGEVAKEVLMQPGKELAYDATGSPESLKKELCHVAAVAVAWMEALADENNEETF